MRKVYIKILSCFMVAGLFKDNLSAQDAVFLYNGIITFEKKTNVNYFLREEYLDNSVFYNSYKEKYPDFSTHSFLLHFNKTTTYYKPEIPIEIGLLNFTDRVAGANEVMIDFATDSFLSRKEVLGKVFIISDENRKPKWKMTDEVRDIAGLKCHRANAVLFDSIYAIAYYCDQIPVSGGPESFGGLPGMILGLAIPKLHTTWFATKISNEGNLPTIYKFNKSSSMVSEKVYFSEVGKLLDVKSNGYIRSILQAKL
jgi:GLPGLI family protein